MTIQNLNHLENPALMGPLPKILDSNNPIAKKSRIVFVQRRNDSRTTLRNYIMKPMPVLKNLNIKSLQEFNKGIDIDRGGYMSQKVMGRFANL